MQYILTFLEGIISFISPCMLPMLPVYISYFGGGGEKKKNVLMRSMAFVIGFTIVFCVLGLFAGTVGSWVNRYKNTVNIICGVIVIIFGLSYLEIVRLPFFKGMNSTKKIDGVFSSLMFGMIYSVSLTPCVGAFLGSALMLASNTGSASEGALLLFVYSLGLGIPFAVSAMLLDSLNGAFTFIKKHYRIINTVCGVFLILIGVLMIFGILDKVMYYIGR